ncbi:MAG: hypothetical protein ACYTCN_06415, partial [Planctomycetota bacterium]
MKKEYLSIITGVVFCLFVGDLWADQSTGVLKLPDNVSVELISPERGMLMLTEENGQVQLPQGKYRLESWTLEKEDDEGCTWKLSGDVNTARMIEVGPEPTTVQIKSEPIVCDLQVFAGPENMNFTLGLNGPSGERLRISGDAPGVKSDQLPQPTFVIYNADRSFEKSHNFQSQCCGNYRFNWRPPAGVAGPFFVDIKVAGPFTIDFEPKNISELHQTQIVEQQAANKRRMKWICITGFCYIAVLTVIVGVLVGVRKSIAASGQKSGSKAVIKRMTLLLGVFVLLMLLDPVYMLVTGGSDIEEAISQCGIVVGLLLAGAAAVWAVRKVRTKWPFVTIMLYGVFFVLLLIPVVFAVFVAFGRPDTGGADIDLEDFGEFYAWLFTFQELEALISWAIILAIIAAQACLLIVPVRIKHQRPKKRRGIWFTAIIAGLLYTALLFFAGLSIIAAVWGDDI